jgi:ABC-type microcin C transport system duplicated ATPase subunit YejF
MSRLLKVENLSVHFPTTRGVVRAVEELSLAIEAGETLALVGESGSGKSTAALAIMGLIDEAAARIPSGSVHFEGSDLRRLSPQALRQVRGRRIGMIFQDPMMALNPVFTVGWQIAEPLRQHLGLSARAARERAIELLHRVGIPAPARGSIPAQSLRRDASAGDDRDGARVPAEPLDRRRAYHGARRDRTGAGARPHQWPQGRDRHGGAVDHA